VWPINTIDNVERSDKTKCNGKYEGHVLGRR